MNSVYQEEIESMNRFRYSIIEKRNSFWDEESGEYDKDGYDCAEDEKKIDELATEIEKYIKNYFDSLPFDFVIEQLSNLGQAPCLIYDDNGHWAVTGSGYASVSLEVDDWEGSFFVKKNEWKNSPKEALYNYINTEE